ncbi:DUF6580 family putative transport protein [Bacteroidota bacterium]
MTAQKLKLKKRKEQKTKLSSKVKMKQKIALHALRKQLQVIKLREVIILSSFILGAGLLRVPMQVLPSAEPITFFALLGGWLFGRKKGFMVGAGALITSNFFVLGGHGPWTIFQALGFGLAGYLGGFLKEKSGYVKTAVVAVLATLVFEAVINLGSMLVFPAGFLVIITALPFIAVHLVSNLIFSFGLPKARRLIHEKGQFNEKALCHELIAQLKRNDRMPKSKQ